MSSTQEPIFFDMETMGLYPTREKILTINLRYRGENIIFKEWEKGEKAIIEQFYEFTTNSLIRKNAKFIGFNILEFDVEFLLERLHHQDYDKSEIDKRWERFARHLAYIDMRQLLGGSGGKFSKWRSALTGVKPNEMKIFQLKKSDPFTYAGDLIPIFYGKGEFTKIEEYVNDELEGMEKMYNAIKKETYYQELQKLRDKTFR